jgi:hypothetical protein
MVALGETGLLNYVMVPRLLGLTKASKPLVEVGMTSSPHRYESLWMVRPIWWQSQGRAQMLQIFMYPTIFISTATNLSSQQTTQTKVNDMNHTSSSCTSPHFCLIKCNNLPDTELSFSYAIPFTSRHTLSHLISLLGKLSHQFGLSPLPMMVASTAKTFKEAAAKWHPSCRRQHSQWLTLVSTLHLNQQRRPRSRKGPAWVQTQPPWVWWIWPATHMTQILIPSKTKLQTSKNKQKTTRHNKSSTDHASAILQVGR